MLSPNGNIHPFIHPQGWTLSTVQKNGGGEQRISPPVGNFTPRGQNSPMGDNFAPGGQSLPLGAKLRMVLWLRRFLCMYGSLARGEQLTRKLIRFGNRIRIISWPWEIRILHHVIRVRTEQISYYEEMPWRRCAGNVPWISRVRVGTFLIFYFLKEVNGNFDSKIEFAHTK
jgi:hypothetical protein